ncbi:alcohol dehydrogenase catalytic domain-containing protein, partial [Cribrihabitans sp. XS_ASV171]
MRAARLTAWRQPLEIGIVPDPDPDHGSVVLRVLACGVCRSDWHAWTGADPDVILPMIPGHEFCGEVVAVGAGVTRWRVGDRVIAPFILACG